MLAVLLSCTYAFGYICYESGKDPEELPCSVWWNDDPPRFPEEGPTSSSTLPKRKNFRFQADEDGLCRFPKMQNDEEIVWDPR